MTPEMIDESIAVAPLEALSDSHGFHWPNIANARHSAHKAISEIKAHVAASNLLEPDTGLVVFGSLARGERTEGSDVDWTLLVDGPANADHLQIVRGIEKLLSENNFGKPNPNGAFGNLAFSPELIHQIGGTSDTNANTTRRILLLLESTSIDDDLVRSRVIRGVLKRYLSEDTPFHFGPDTHRTPRFLLNDIVRFWRTMAVDFASKQRERGGQSWALRNAKLRLSRKLIFVSGLLMCYRFHCRLGENTPPEDEEKMLLELVNRLMIDVNLSPLDVVARSVIDLGIDDNITRGIFDSYNDFLGILNDKTKRDYLNSLSYEDAQNNEDFKKVRDLSTNFQRSLIALFFDSNEDLSKWVKEYGIF